MMTDNMAVAEARLRMAGLLPSTKLMKNGKEVKWNSRNARFKIGKETWSLLYVYPHGLREFGLIILHRPFEQMVISADLLGMEVIYG